MAERERKKRDHNLFSKKLNSTCPVLDQMTDKCIFGGSFQGPVLAIKLVWECLARTKNGSHMIFLYLPAVSRSFHLHMPTLCPEVIQSTFLSAWTEQQNNYIWTTIMRTFLRTKQPLQEINSWQIKYRGPEYMKIFSRHVKKLKLVEQKNWYQVSQVKQFFIPFKEKCGYHTKTTRTK